MTTPSERARFERAQRYFWWTAERVVRLVELLKDPRKLTAAQIGKELDCTKMAIIGKVNRLHLKLARKSGSHGRPKGSSKPHGRQAPWAPPHPPPQQDKFMTRVVDLPHAYHCQVADLDNSRCRWPYGDPGSSNFFFCGLPEADMAARVPYCTAHMKAAYVGKRGPQAPRTHIRSAYDPMSSAA